MVAAAGYLAPAGWTPLAAAIEAGTRTLANQAGDSPRVLYVVSDGVETCGGDPVATARAAQRAGQSVIVNVISFGAPSSEQAQLRAVAEAGGGQFMDARDAASLREALRKMAEASVRDFHLRTASTRARNVMNSGDGVSRATQCMTAAMREERTAVTAAIAADETAGKATREQAASARERLNARGSEASQALVAYSQVVQAGEQAQAAEMWRRFEDAKTKLALHASQKP